MLENYAHMSPAGLVDDWTFILLSMHTLVRDYVGCTEDEHSVCSVTWPVSGHC